MATLLQLVQQASAEMGLSYPNQIAGSTASDPIQLLALINAVGYELLNDNSFNWQKTIVEYRFTTQYTETTGDTVSGNTTVTIPSTTGLDSTYMVLGTNILQDTYISSISGSTDVILTNAPTSTLTGTDLTFCKTKYAMPSDYLRAVNRTQWDKSNHWEMVGAESSQEWQWLKSGYVQTTPRVRFRQLGGMFQIWPPQAFNNLYGFEYVSQNWVYDVNGNPKSSFTQDTDTCIFPDRLMVAGLKLKYWQVKGFDSTAFMRDYTIQLSGAKSADAGAKTLNLTPTPATALIGWASIPDSGYGRT